MRHRLEITVSAIQDDQPDKVIVKRHLVTPSLSDEELEWLVRVEIDKVRQALAVKEQPKEHRHD